MRVLNTLAQERFCLHKIAWYGYLLMLVLLPIVKTPSLPYVQQMVQVSDIFFLVVLCLWLMSLAVDETRLRWSRLYLPMGALLVAMALSLINAQDALFSVIKLVAKIYLVLLAVVTYNLVNSERRLREALLAWMAGTALVILFGFVGITQWLLGGYASPFVMNDGKLSSLPVPRIISTFRNPNLMAEYLLVSIFIMIGFLASGWPKRHRWLTVLLAGALITLLLSLSRGIFSFGVGLVVFAALLKRSTGYPISQHRLGLAIGCLAGFALVIFVFTA